MSYVKNNEKRNLDRIEFRPFDEESREEWDAFVFQSEFCWLDQLSIFLDERQKQSHQENCSHSVRIEGKLVGLLCLFIEKRGLGRILTGYGPVGQDGGFVGEVEENIYEWCEAFALRQGCLSIRFHANSYAPAMWGKRYFDTIFAKRGYAFGFRGDSFDYEASCWIVANLNRPEAEILADFAKSDRCYVGKCKKLKLDIVVMQSDSIDERVWLDFINLNGMTLDRNGVERFPLSHFDFLLKNIRDKFAILIALYQDGICLANVYIYTYKYCAYYEAAGNSLEGLHLRVPVYLHYIAMKELKGRSIKYYSLGCDTPSAGRPKDRQISKFKRRFGNEVWDNLVCELVLKRKKYWLFIIIPYLVRAKLAKFGFLKYLKRFYKNVFFGVKER